MSKVDENRCIARTKKFAYTLIKLRKQKNISQEELALRIDSSQTYLSQLEGGRKYPSLLFLYKLAEGLEIDIQEFFVEND